jgi:hypothetical protein
MIFSFLQLLGHLKVLQLFKLYCLSGFRKNIYMLDDYMIYRDSSSYLFSKLPLLELEAAASAAATVVETDAAASRTRVG